MTPKECAATIKDARRKIDAMQSEIDRIAVPTLVVHARNDPFLPGRYLPENKPIRGPVEFEFPERGGHVGFVTGAFPGKLSWLPRRTLDFLAEP